MILNLFIDYIYKNIEEYNPNKKRKKLIVLYLVIKNLIQW